MKKKEPKREDVYSTYKNYVEYIASTFYLSVEKQDQAMLAQAGFIGVMEALRDYDPEKNLPLQDYIGMCVKRQIIDCIRSMDIASRYFRKARRDLNTAIQDLTTLYGRPPSKRELQIRLGWDKEYLDEIMSGINYISLEVPIRDDKMSLVVLGDILPDSAQTEETVSRNLYREKLWKALLCLDERKRNILIQYYIEEQTLEEIGCQYDLSPGRISQLRGEAITHVRKELGISGQKEKIIFMNRYLKIGK